MARPTRVTHQPNWCPTAREEIEPTRPLAPDRAHCLRKIVIESLLEKVAVRVRREQVAAQRARNDCAFLIARRRDRTTQDEVRRVD
jgi:hypothetical protein